MQAWTAMSCRIRLLASIGHHVSAASCLQPQYGAEHDVQLHVAAAWRCSGACCAAAHMWGGPSSCFSNMELVNKPPARSMHTSTGARAETSQSAGQSPVPSSMQAGAR